MAKVLVTGGAGFIGSHLVRALLERGDQVRVLDNLSTGKAENLEGLPGVEIHQADLRDKTALNKALQGVETVFHLAAFVSVPQSLEDPETCFSVNVGGTISLLETARLCGARKVVLASSTAVYGDTRIFPTTEDTPLDPLSPYALSKQVTELYARMYTRHLGLAVVALRFFNVYGPRQRSDSAYAAAIPIFLQRLLHREPITIFGDGGQTRDFVFVGDVVDANLKVADSPAAGEVFNVCSGREISILTLMEELSELLDDRSGSMPQIRFEPARAGDIYRSLGDPGKAAATFGFQASTSLADGLKQTLDWMRMTDPSHG